MNLQFEGRDQAARPVTLFPQEKYSESTSLQNLLKAISDLEQTPHREQPRGVLPLGKAWPHSLCHSKGGEGATGWERHKGEGHSHSPAWVSHCEVQFQFKMAA